MLGPNETKVEQLRGSFEGREAIYVEYGALLVRVSSIFGMPPESMSQRRSRRFRPLVCQLEPFVKANSMSQVLGDGASRVAI
jgi:hypothetical protein